MGTKRKKKVRKIGRMRKSRKRNFKMAMAKMPDETDTVEELQRAIALSMEDPELAEAIALSLGGDIKSSEGGGEQKSNKTVLESNSNLYAQKIYI